MARARNLRDWLHSTLRPSGGARAVHGLPQARAQRVEETQRAVARDLSGTQVASQRRPRVGAFVVTFSWLSS